MQSETFAFLGLGLGVLVLPSISDWLSHAEKVINPDSEPKIFLDLQEKSLDKLPSRMDAIKKHFWS